MFAHLMRQQSATETDQELQEFQKAMTIACLNIMSKDERHVYWNRIKELRRDWRGEPLTDWIVFEENFIVNGEII